MGIQNKAALHPELGFSPGARASPSLIGSFRKTRFEGKMPSLQGKLSKDPLRGQDALAPGNRGQDALDSGNGPPACRERPSCSRCKRGRTDPAINKARGENDR